MQTDAPIPVEAIARKPLVGVDDRGNRHRFDRYRDIVYVLDSDEQVVAHVEHLQSGQLPEWVDYVRQRRDWTDCRYGTGGAFETLARHLATQLEGDA